MKTCKQLSLEWGISVRTITDLCKNGKILGAKKVGRTWKIPDDVIKPEDKRIKTGEYVKEVKPLPIGISDYVRAQSEYYYVDKTLFIKEFLDQKPLVSLFTRPRRFGKTLHMDMLRVFFEISEKDTSIYFKDKAIWKCGQEYRKHQGKYPVVFMTFKDVKFDTWKDTIDKIKGLLQAEFARHMILSNSEYVAEYERVFFHKVLEGTASEVELTSALEVLSRMLYEHYQVAPIIIIDEYDTPIQEGYAKDFYDEIIGFMRNFFSGAFKDNKHLTYGFLTGILRIAQESIFSGLNNLTVNTILDTQYQQYFGFTYMEVKNLLTYYGVTKKEAELKEWYDGYLFGNTEIYNPWSVINYISKKCVPQAYWVNTGKNEILEEVLNVATDDIIEKLYDLLSGKKVIARIDQNVLYRALTQEPANIYSLLLVAGYLKAESKKIMSDGAYLCEVSIPNKEIAAVYKNEILTHLLQIGDTMNQINKIKKEFTKQAKNFENYQQKFFSKAEFNTWAIEKMQLSGKENVLEVAAGTCALGRMVAPFVNMITELDATKAMLEIGKREGEKEGLQNLSFREGLAESLPFDDDIFHIVMSRLAFHHFLEVEPCFKEMVRVLKSGGRMVIIDMEARNENLREIADGLEILRDCSHVKCLSREEFVTLAKENNLTILTCEMIPVPVSLNSWMELTRVDEKNREIIISAMKEEMAGGNKTGFEPYVKDYEIYFDQKWLLVIAEK